MHLPIIVAFENRLGKAFSCYVTDASKESTYIINIIDTISKRFRKEML